MQGTMRICWLFGLPSTHKLCTNQPHVLCPCSNLSAFCDPFFSRTFSVKNRATNGKRSHLLHLLLLIYMKCQDDHNTMKMIHQLDLSKVWSTSSLTAPNSGKGDTLAIATCQTKVTRGRLTLIRIEDHKEQICRLSRPA